MISFYFFTLSVVAVNAELFKAADIKPLILLNGTEFVDRILDTARNGIISSGFDEIHPPNVKLPLGRNQSVAIYNQTIIGLANIKRVGDVTVETSFFSIKYKSAFSIYNVSSDSDVQILTRRRNYTEGHVHMICDNVTAHEVIKLTHLTQSLSLDEFELSVGDCSFNVTGLGERAENGSALVTKALQQVKEPVLLFFNIALRSAINSALTAARGAIAAG